MFRLEHMSYINTIGVNSYSFGTAFNINKMTYEVKAYALDRRVTYGDEINSYSVSFKEFYDFLVSNDFLGKCKYYGKLFICSWSRSAQLCKQYISFNRLLSMRQAPDVSYNAWLVASRYSVDINKFDPYNLARSSTFSLLSRGKVPMCDIGGVSSPNLVFDASNVVDYILANPNSCSWINDKLYILRSSFPDIYGKTKAYVAEYSYDKKLLKHILAYNGDLNNV